MNEEEYNKIMKEVKEEKLTEKYEIKKGTLYRRKNDKLLKVIRKYEWKAVMYIMHDHPTSAHFGVKATYNKVKAINVKDVENHKERMNYIQFKLKNHFIRYIRK